MPRWQNNNCTLYFSTAALRLGAVLLLLAMRNPTNSEHSSKFNPSFIQQKIFSTFPPTLSISQRVSQWRFETDMNLRWNGDRSYWLDLEMWKKIIKCLEKSQFWCLLGLLSVFLLSQTNWFGFLKPKLIETLFVVKIKVHHEGNSQHNYIWLRFEI